MKYRPFIVIFICAVLAISCGGDSVSDSVIASAGGAWQSPEENLPINLQVDSGAQGIASSATPPRNDNAIAPSDQRTNAPDYSGKVVIKFKDGTDVRLRPEDRNGPFVSLAGADVSGVNEVVQRTRHPREGGDLDRAMEIPASAGMTRVTNITRVMTASEEEVSRWQEYWRKRGVTLHDWNLYYYLEVPEYEDARELVGILSCHPCENRDPECANEIPACAGMTELVEYSEILPIFYLTSVTTPDMSDEQDYLKSAAEGGLGVEDAWAKLDEQFPDIKLRGQNSMVVDQEYDWNFDHEILPIDETQEYYAGTFSWWNTLKESDGKGVPTNINHGTAVVGIISAQGNEIGKAIKGIASKTHMQVQWIGTGTGIMGCAGILYGEYGEGPGPILTIEIQQKGLTTSAAGCAVGDGTSGPIVTGCVPLEAHKFLIDNIQDATNCGYIIIEGAGNGGVNLDDPNQAAPIEGMEYFSDFSNPANDSGAIMVGASMGADRKKAAWSNCGSRVDVYAWGAGVVTSGYGDKYNPDGADPSVIGPMGADNPKLYTGQFGGTSAATAQIAGIAALVQSYVRQLVAEAGYEPKVVYLDSKQMREILKNSGQPAVYGQTPNDPNPNCNIGVQPDMVQAIEETNKFLNAGNVLKVVPLNGNSDPNGGPGGGVVAGIRYDMDNDGRAELISFSRDHKWYIDLSSVQPEAQSVDGYGEWDVILTIPSPLMGEGNLPADGVVAGGEGGSNGTMLFSVVHDYNSDGWADLALYDSINGKWYIKYSGQWLVAGDKEKQIEWDRIIDYSADPMWKAYSRPVPGDYDGDNWLDTALQTPDGHWLIDYGGYKGGAEEGGITIHVNEDGTATVDLANPLLSKLGQFDKDVKYLTDEQLAQAPGWAWLPATDNMTSIKGNIVSDILIRVPDGLANEGKLFVGEEPDYFLNDTELPAIYGSNDVFFTTAIYDGEVGCTGFGLKHVDGTWQVSFCGTWEIFKSPTPDSGYGDIICRPVPADYDGDGKDDRAVQCGTSWKIAYSNGAPNFREVELDQALDPVPAYVYPGGIKYQDTVDLYSYYKTELGGTKTSTIFDALPPIGPYFAQCVKYWAPNASYCWDK